MITLTKVQASQAPQRVVQKVDSSLALLQTSHEGWHHDARDPESLVDVEEDLLEESSVGSHSLSGAKEPERDQVVDCEDTVAKDEVGGEFGLAFCFLDSDIHDDGSENQQDGDKLDPGVEGRGWGGADVHYTDWADEPGEEPLQKRDNKCHNVHDQGDREGLGHFAAAGTLVLVFLDLCYLHFFLE